MLKALSVKVWQRLTARQTTWGWLAQPTQAAKVAKLLVRSIQKPNYEHRKMDAYIVRLARKDCLSQKLNTCDLPGASTKHDKDIEL
jgi:hypothetical protein